MSLTLVINTYIDNPYIVIFNNTITLGWNLCAYFSVKTSTNFFHNVVNKKKNYDNKKLFSTHVNYFGRIL